MEKDDITPKVREEISHHFREQLTYYEDIKPWKLYLRQKLLETVRRQKGFTPTSKLAKDYFKNNDNNQNMTTYFAETAQLATAVEMETELDNFPSNYRVIQDAAMHMSQATIPTVDPNWVPTEDLERDFLALTRRPRTLYSLCYIGIQKSTKRRKFPSTIYIVSVITIGLGMKHYTKQVFQHSSTQNMRGDLCLSRWSRIKWLTDYTSNNMRYSEHIWYLRQYLKDNGIVIQRNTRMNTWRTRQQKFLDATTLMTRLGVQKSSK